MNRNDENLRNQEALDRAHRTMLNPDEPIVPTRVDRDFSESTTCAMVLLNGKLEADLDKREGGDK